MLVDIRIDEGAWDAAPPDRRREWRHLIDELLQQQTSDQEDPLRLIIAPAFAGTIRLGLETVDGYPLRELGLPLKVLRPHFEEYADICDQLATVPEGVSSSRLEALDMGKRVVHDRAAKTLLEHCGSVVRDPRTARNFFSLLVSLHTDRDPILRGGAGRLD